MWRTVGDSPQPSRDQAHDQPSPASAAGQSRSFDIGSGNPGFRYFSLDAPAYDFSVNGNPDFCGSFIVKTLSGNGNTTWHYDEALATVGLVTAYQRAMWVEDER